MNESSQEGVYQRINQTTPKIDLDTIPTLSQASMQLVNIIFDKEVSIEQVVDVVQKDVNLSLEVVRVANSPRYRTSTTMDSVSKAIVHLGLDAIKSIVLSISITGTMKDILSEECFSLVLSYSLATATSAQILSNYVTGVNAETAFLIGLFLDLGLFICASLYPKEFINFVDESKKTGIHLKSVIKEKLNIDTNELSFLAAKKWNLPKIILENINCHPLIQKKIDDPAVTIPPLAIVSHLSMLASNVYFGSTTIVSITLFKNHFLLLLDKSNALASEVLNLLSDEFNDSINTLGLDLPKQEGYIETLKKSNKQLLNINNTHEAMYRELYKQSSAIEAIKQELVKKNKIMSKLVTVDPLTSLYNRKFLIKNLERLIAESKRYKNALSIILLDIDLFSKTNELYGQKAGDEVLVQIAQCLKVIFRDSDICSRYSGEEFVVILPQTELKGAVLAAEKIRQKIASHVFKLSTLSPPIDINISVSIAVASVSEEFDSTTALFNRCDLVMSKAKSEGRNCVRS